MQQRRVIAVDLCASFLEVMVDRLDSYGHDAVLVQCYEDVRKELKKPTDFIVANELISFDGMPKELWERFQGDHCNWTGIALFYALKEQGMQLPYFMLGSCLNDTDALGKRDSEILRQSLNDGMTAHIDIAEADLNDVIKIFEEKLGYKLSG
ncbi:MAG: hypothetical protein ABIG30_01965 [Candidatus Aenigmatarchaeota archaeon]